MKYPKTEPGLDKLLHPRSVAEFLAQRETQKPFVVERVEGLDSLTKLPCFQSLESFFAVWPFPVNVHLPKVSDEASAIDVSVTDARKLFENGMNLMFDNVERISPELNHWLEAIRRDLGLSALTQSRCLVYATREGKGTSPHFDQNANFVLQLHGTKKWWLAPNHHVSHPLSRHTMGLAVDPELETYSELPFPVRMPEGATPILLTPGTLLYVPRGTWHSTKADDDSLSLNFTYSAPSWLDLFTAALRSRLALSPEWRETAQGLADPSERELAEAKFDRLLTAMTEDLPNWRAAEILEATDG